MLRRCSYARTLPAVAALATAHAQSNYAVVRGSSSIPSIGPLPVRTSISNRREHRRTARSCVECNGTLRDRRLQPGTYDSDGRQPGIRSRPRQNINLEVGQQATLDIDLHVSDDTQTVTVEASRRIAQDPGCQRWRSRRSAFGRFPPPERPHADRPCAHRARRAHQPWRRHRRHESPLLAPRPALRRQHRRQPSQRELLPARRRHQHRSHLQHAEPQRFARCGAGVPGADRQLLGRNGRRRRRPDQHRHPLRHRHISTAPPTSFCATAPWTLTRSTRWACRNFLVQNNFGASIGGPVWHTGKTFFFVNYEGLRNVETMTMVDTVPTA